MSKVQQLLGTELTEILNQINHELVLDAVQDEPPGGLISPQQKAAQLARQANEAFEKLSVEFEEVQGQDVWDPSVKVYSEACPLFVPFVEEGWLEGDVVSKVARVYLAQLKSFGIDTLILGCTHYPLLAAVIQKTIGAQVKLVNSAEETAKEAKELLKKLKINSLKKKSSQTTRCYVSDEPEQFRTLGERFLGQSIHSVAKVGDYVRESEYVRG